MEKIKIDQEYIILKDASKIFGISVSRAREIMKQFDLIRSDIECKNDAKNFYLRNG